MSIFDLLLHGGTVIDGTGAACRRVDVGVLGDRVVAIGDLSTVDAAGIELVLDVTGRVAAPASLTGQPPPAQSRRRRGTIGL